MEDQAKMIESLLSSATEYGKTSLEIVKLKALDKSSDVISTFIIQAILFVIVLSFFAFLNLGIAIWIGKMVGQLYLGFFMMAGFYCLAGLIYYLFMHDWLKAKINNYIIKQVLK